MDIIIELFSKLASGIGPFFLLLGLLIFVHELGHFLVAVYFGVRVETFSLGFGKKIFSKTRGDTTYCLSLIPLGGYVKMYGDDPTADVPAAQKKYSFLHKPVAQRIAIVLAGPLMNLFFAIFIFSVMAIVGESVPSSQLGDIEDGTAAYSAGFRSGDKVLEVNGKAVVQWSEVKSEIESHADKTMTFKVAREGAERTDEVKVTPKLIKNPFLFTTQREIGAVDGLTTESNAAIIGVADPNSIAAQAGLKSFDLIESINGNPVTYWREIESHLLPRPGTESALLVVRSFTDESKNAKTRRIELKVSRLQPGKGLLPQLGILSSHLFLSSVREGTPAAKNGMMSGDYVIEVDDQPVTKWQAVLDRVKSFTSEQKQISFTVVRNGEEFNFNVTPDRVELPTDQGAMEKRYAIGVVPAIVTAPNAAHVFKHRNPLTALKYGVEQSWVWTKLISISLVRLVQNEVSAKNIGGVITIGRVASKSFEVGINAFLKMMAIISINLFLLNLLPVPVLDGGHLVFFTIEALKGAPISFKKLEIAQQVGLVLLLSLMLFALFNDISHLISSW